MRKFIELGNYMFAIKNIAYVQRTSNTVIAIQIENEQFAHHVSFKTIAEATEAYEHIKLLLNMYSEKA